LDETGENKKKRMYRGKVYLAQEGKTKGRGSGPIIANVSSRVGKGDTEKERRALSARGKIGCQELRNPSGKG